MDYSLPDSSVRGIFSGKNTGVGCHFLLQGIFLTCVSGIAFTAEPPGKPLLFISALILVLLPEVVRIMELVLECTLEINILRVKESPSLFLFFFFCHPKLLVGFPGGSAVKNPSAIQETQETWVQSLHQEDILEKEIATHSSILAWKIPQTEEQGVGHNWARMHAVLCNIWDILSKVKDSYCIWLLLPPSCTMLREPLEATYTSFNHTIPVYLVSSPISCLFWVRPRTSKDYAKGPVCQFAKLLCHLTLMTQQIQYHLWYCIYDVCGR